MENAGLDFGVRNAGHVGVFGILSLLAWRAIATTIRLRHAWFSAAATAIFYPTEFRNVANIAFASSAAGSPAAAIVAAVPTATRKPDSGPFQAHWPAIHPPLGICFAWTEPPPMTFDASTVERSAQVSRLPALVAAGVALALGVLSTVDGAGLAPSGVVVAIPGTSLVGVMVNTGGPESGEPAVPLRASSLLGVAA